VVLLASFTSTDVVSTDPSKSATASHHTLAASCTFSFNVFPEEGVEASVGEVVGASVGEAVTARVGEAVDARVGEAVDARVGEGVGEVVGTERVLAPYCTEETYVAPADNDVINPLKTTCSPETEVSLSEMGALNSCSTCSVQYPQSVCVIVT